MRRADGELILFWTLPALGVLWVSAFFLFPGFANPMSPRMSPGAVAAFYDGNTERIRYSMILFNWVGIALIPMLMLLAMQIKRMAHRTPILAYSLIGCAAGGPAMFLCANLFWLVAAFRPDRAAEATQMLNDLAWVTFTCSVPFLVAQSVFIAVAIFLDDQPVPVLPRWVAHFNLATAAAFVPAAFAAMAQTGPVAWDGLLSFWVKNVAIAVWIVVMAVVLWRNIHAERRQAEAVAA